MRIRELVDDALKANQESVAARSEFAQAVFELDMARDHINQSRARVELAKTKCEAADINLAQALARIALIASVNEATEPKEGDK